jgi:uncharacterized membrane protein
MLHFSLIIQALHLAAWVIMLIGSAALLRRGYASAGASMFIGAAAVMLMAIVNLAFFACQAYGWVAGIDLGKMMVMVGLVSAVGLFLFALGFVQLARTVRRED